MFRQYHIRNYCFPLMAAVTALSVIGIMVIGSAQSGYEARQSAGLIIGLVMMVILSLIDYTSILKFRWILYILGCGLLAAVLVAGRNIGGAERWIVIAGVQFQPSDLMKLILILFFAGFFQAHENRLNTPGVLALSVVLIAAPLLLIMKEPDLSTTIVTAIVFCAIIFSAGLSMRLVISVLVIVVPAVAIFFSRELSSSGSSLLQDYQMTRILAWLHPEQYPDEARQQQNSIIAIGSGQLYGKGLNTTAVNSVKNGNFISESQTDFIFAVAGEELGFMGCLLIVLLELFIGITCFRIALRSKQKAGALICMGMGALVISQSALNISVATGLMPNTGITLPFVSYGMTSLITFCMGIGFCLNVGLQPKREYIITSYDRYQKMDGNRIRLSGEFRP